MKIRDIVNRDIVNLTNCEHEPIHIPGSIQPHGFLLAVNTSGAIEFCSANVVRFTGVTHEQLLGKPLTALFPEKSTMLSYFTTATSETQPPFTVQFGDTTCSCSVHRSGEMFIAEFEIAEEQPYELSALYHLNLESIRALQTADSLQQLCQCIAEQIRKLTGYDRVMIYRFDEQYNGEVYAETKEENLEPFLGLHYPHTDIPAQARQLYITNLLRVIADVNYTPEPLYTIDDAPGKNLDLGMASLRSVSPIHIEYLQNMGVSATLTISLLHQEKLWGLVACHHYSGPKLLSPYIRVSARLLAQLLTSQIDVRQVAEEYQLAIQVNHALEKLLTDTYTPDRKLFAHLISQPEILAVCNAAGAAILFDGKVYTSGHTPGPEQVMELAAAIRPLAAQGVFTTHKLAGEWPDGEAICDTAAGVLFHEIQGTGTDCILWFRGETLEEVHWAGDPDKAIIKNEKGLSPRNSFDLWKQIIKCSSRPWAVPELSAAATFANTLQKHIHLLLLSEEEIRYRQLSIELKDANAELENINWISTHDLREPLRKIQVFSSRILSSDTDGMPDMVLNSVERMNESANRMQRLISDITSYSKLRHNREEQLDIDLNAVLADVQAELQPDLAETGGAIHSAALPNVKGTRMLLNQLFLNLLRNAIKFRSETRTPAISITCEDNVAAPVETAAGKRFYKISVRDNGIGIDNKHSENIFKVFTRLHNQDAYKGSGIGLALCRQIMQIHGGFIRAEGVPGEGTVFHLYFPMRAAE